MRLAWWIKKKAKSLLQQRTSKRRQRDSKRFCVEGESNISGEEGFQVLRLLPQSPDRHERVQVPTGAAEHGAHAKPGNSGRGPVHIVEVHSGTGRRRNRFRHKRE